MIDDEAGVGELISATARRLGLQCSATTDPKTFMDTLSPDTSLVILDLLMPEMDGIEATRIIRETLAVQPVIIALTANTMHGDEDKCISAGMNDYISKPVNLEEVVAKLEKWASYKKRPDLDC